MKKTPRSRKPSLSEAAYAIIKHKIVTLELPPGSVVDEAGLRSGLGLGRTPIREALQRLAQEKLINIAPRHGTFVSNIDAADLQRVSEIRLALEPVAARLAAQRSTEEHWRQIEEILGDLDDESEVAIDTLIEIDEICHRALYEAADNRYLEDILNTLYALSLRLWHYALPQIGDMRDAVLEHRRILNALKSRDEDLAAQLVERHILAFRDEIEAIMVE